MEQVKTKNYYELINNEFNDLEVAVAIEDIAYIITKNNKTYEKTHERYRREEAVTKWFPQALDVAIGKFAFSNSTFEFGSWDFEFVIVKTEKGIWSYVFNGHNKDQLLKHYHKKQGLSYQTNEQRLLEMIEANAQFDDLNAKVYNTSEQRLIKEIEHEQKIKISGRATVKKAKQFFNEYMLTSVPSYLQMYPDIVVRRGNNTKGNPIFEFIELEKSASTKSFKTKLFKYEMAQRKVSFIIADYIYDYYYGIIEEFLTLPYIKHKYIRICKLSEFEQQGMKALKYFI